MFASPDLADRPGVLLVPLGDIKPGAVVAASVRHPTRPATELLRPGTPLTESMLKQMKRIRIRSLWIEVDGATDLPPQTAAGLSAAQHEVYTHLKASLTESSGRVASAASVAGYRQAVMGMVCEAVAGRDFAGLTYRMMSDENGGGLAHAASVAYLAVVVGLELESYLVRNRPRLSPNEARDVVGLGLAGMLHDVGKLESPKQGETHEVTSEPDEWPEGYDEHSLRGFRMLQDSRMCPAARNAILMHHRRFDGTGWPDPPRTSAEVMAGPRLHVFARIISAVNVLDNLLQDAESRGGCAVDALHAFCSARFDGWFDPVVRWGVARAIPPYGVGTLVTLSDGRQAGIAQPVREHPCRPTVRLLDGSTSDEPLVHLVDRPDLRIVACGDRAVGDLAYELPAVRTMQAAA